MTQRRPKTKLTLKSLGHVEDRGRFWLSASYANARDNYKVVEEYVLGYYVTGNGYHAPVRIAPIYRATIYMRLNKRRAIITSHEVGDYYNPPYADPDDLYREDQIANRMATTVFFGIASVIERAAEHARKTPRSTKTTKRGRRT